MSVDTTSNSIRSAVQNGISLAGKGNNGVRDFGGSPAGAAMTLPWTSIDFPEKIGPFISTPNPIITQMRLQWDLVDSLWEGTTAMRAKAEMYLPRAPAETNEQYIDRLRRTTLYNAFKKTIQNGVARVMSVDVDVKSDNADIVLFADDVDSHGRSITQFGKEILENAIRHGVSFVLTDYSRLAQDFESLEDERNSGARPYWVSIPATNVLDARVEFINGKQRLQLFRYEEIVNVLNQQDYSNSQHRQVRIFQLDNDGVVNYAVYRLDKPYSHAWILQDKGVLPFLQDIPISPCYGNRIGYCMGKPVLMDLAEKNIEHWQLGSDVTNIIRYATIPVLFAKGFGGQLDENGAPKSFVISPQQAIYSASTEASLSWVELAGDSIPSAKQHLKDLEDQMEKLGMSLTTSQPGTLTATEKAINTSEANSTLKSIAMNLQEAFEQSLFFVSQFMAEQTQDIDVCVNTQYAVDYADSADYQTVLMAFQAGVINKETVIEEGRRRNILNPRVPMEEMLSDEEPDLEAETAADVTKEQSETEAPVAPVTDKNTVPAAK